MGLIICRPHYTYFRRVMRCPACKVRRRMLVAEEEWYGPTITCCTCGFEASESRICDNRNKKRRAQRAIEAKALWRDAHSPSYFRTWVESWLGSGR